MMDAPAPSTEQFLRVVGWVSELEALDSTLARAGRELWARLARAEDEADADLYDATLHRLGTLGMLRGEIARELTRMHAEGRLQVLATSPAPVGEHGRGEES